MAWVKMPIQEQWTDDNDVNAAGYVLKAYLPGTTTSTPIAIDSGGAVTASTITLNADGLPEVSGNEVVPYIDRNFKYAIFRNSSDASANSNPYFGFIDNVEVDLGQGSTTVADYATFRTNLTAGIYEAGTMVSVLSPSGNPFQIFAGTGTDNAGTTIAGTGFYGERVRDYATPEMFGVGSDADYSTEMQNFFDHIRDTGEAAKGTGATYRVDQALTLVSTSITPKNYTIDWGGSIIDASNTAVTTGDFLTLGATSQANGHDTEFIKWENFKLLGPETGSPYAGDTPATSLVGLSLEYAFNLTLSNYYIQGFYIGVNTNFVFPALIEKAELKANFIGAYIDSDSTMCHWDQPSITSARYPIVIRPGGSGLVSGQRFTKPRFENCLTGPVLATDNTTASIAIRDVVFNDPYFESITYDFYRVGLNWTFADPQTRNSDSPRDIIWCGSKGGVWGGAGWSGTSAPLVLTSTGTVIDGEWECAAAESLVIGDRTNTTYISTYDVTVGSSSVYEDYSPRVQSKNNQPSFSAYLNAQANNVTGDGTNYTVICDTEDFDVGADYNTTTGAYTAAFEGKYYINFKGSFGGLTSSHTRAYMRIVTTDKTVLKNFDPYVMADNFNEVVVEMSDVFYLDVGDTATFTIAIFNGTAVVDVKDTETRVSGYFLG